MSARAPEEAHALRAAAFKAGDLDAFAAMYEENAVLLVPPAGERVNGRDEIRKALAAQFALEDPAPRSGSSRSSRVTGSP
jgi:ketosteroid isomerase-like protein